MTKYLYKSNTFANVQSPSGNYLVTQEPGITLLEPVKELDEMVGTRLSKWVDGVQAAPFPVGGNDPTDHFISSGTGWKDLGAIGGGSSLGTPTAFVALGVTTDVLGTNDGILKDLTGTPIPGITANVIPRTGTEAALLALAGNSGEIASATDTNAIVKFNGVSGGAKKFSPYGNVRNNGVLTTIKPDADLIIITGGAKTLSNGEYVGHTVKLYAGAATNVNVTGVINIASLIGCIIKLLWNGTAWKHIGTESLNALNVNGGTSVGGGVAASSSSVAIGAGLANGVGSTSIGGGQASGVGSIAIGLVSTTLPYEVALPGPRSGYHSYIPLFVTTINATPTVLTTDGLAATDLNRFGVSDASGSYSELATYRVTILAAEPGTTNAARLVWNIMASCFADTNGLVIPTFTLNNAAQESNVNAGILASAAASISATGRISVTVTGIVGRTIEWSAIAEKISAYVTDPA